MNCLLSGAIVRIGGAQKRADGVAGAKYSVMDRSKKIKELRESTGMNRREFCDYFDIPYRTVTEWERDNRHAPEYVLRLLEYYIRMENLIKDTEA